MNFSINPLTLQSMKIGTPKEQGHFLYQLSALLSQMVSAITQNQQIGGNQFTPVIKVYSNITTNQTLNCANATMVMIDIVFTAAVTVTLTNLIPGIPIAFRAVNNTAGTLVLKLAASNPSGTSYGFFSLSGGVATDFTGVGVSFTANNQRMCNGAADAVNVFVGMS